MTVFKSVHVPVQNQDLRMVDENVLEQSKYPNHAKSKIVLVSVVFSLYFKLIKEIDVHVSKILKYQRCVFFVI